MPPRQQSSSSQNVQVNPLPLSRRRAREALYDPDCPGGHSKAEFERRLKHKPRKHPSGYTRCDMTFTSGKDIRLAPKVQRFIMCTVFYHNDIFDEREAKAPVRAMLMKDYAASTIKSISGPVICEIARYIEAEAQYHQNLPPRDRTAQSEYWINMMRYDDGWLAYGQSHDPQTNEFALKMPHFSDELPSRPPSPPPEQIQQSYSQSGTPTTSSQYQTAGGALDRQGTAHSAQFVPVQYYQPGAQPNPTKIDGRVHYERLTHHLASNSTYEIIYRRPNDSFTNGIEPLHLGQNGQKFIAHTAEHLRWSSTEIADPLIVVLGHTIAKRRWTPPIIDQIAQYIRDQRQAPKSDLESVHWNTILSNDPEWTIYAKSFIRERNTFREKMPDLSLNQRLGSTLRILPLEPLHYDRIDHEPIGDTYQIFYETQRPHPPYLFLGPHGQKLVICLKLYLNRDKKDVADLLAIMIEGNRRYFTPQAVTQMARYIQVQSQNPRSSRESDHWNTILYDDPVWEDYARSFNRVTNKFPPDMPLIQLVQGPNAGQIVEDPYLKYPKRRAGPHPTTSAPLPTLAPPPYPSDTGVPRSTYGSIGNQPLPFGTHFPQTYSTTTQYVPSTSAEEGMSGMTITEPHNPYTAHEGPGRQRVSRNEEEMDDFLDSVRGHSATRSSNPADVQRRRDQSSSGNVGGRWIVHDNDGHPELIPNPLLETHAGQKHGRTSTPPSGNTSRSSTSAPRDPRGHQDKGSDQRRRRHDEASERPSSKRGGSERERGDGKRNDGRKGTGDKRRAKEDRHGYYEHEYYD